MARLLVLFALCVLPAIVSATIPNDHFIVTGCAYCDTCRVGFETPATKYLAGAKVKVECKDRHTDAVTLSVDGVTDSTGTYKILVTGDYGEDVCDAILVSSADPDCATPNAGRDRARVILTRANGMVSNTRFANAMGFLKNEPLARCTQVLQMYKESED